MRPVILVTTLALLLPTFASAQAPHRERAQDRREVRHDKGDLRDGRRDLDRIEKIRDDYRRAITGRSARAVNRVEARLTAWLDEELREDRREVRQDKRELQRSRRELRRDARYETRRGVRDDRRDRRDDRRDLALERGERQRHLQLERELRGLLGRKDRRSLQRKAAILDELVSLQRAELRQDRQELREDRQERREDRRRR